MKRLILITIGLIYSLMASATQLFMLPTGSAGQIKDAFGRKDIVIHYYNDDFLIGTTTSQLPAGAVILDREAWSAGENYFIIRLDGHEEGNYKATIAHAANILYEGKDFLIVSADDRQGPRLYPAIHGGLIRIKETPAKYPAKTFGYKPGTLDARDGIFAMIGQVNVDTLEAFVQQLQDYGTRNAYKPGGVLAQNWILDKFNSYGLAAELDDFYMPGGPASDNVIATLTGTTFPDEYVILGAHYDSYTGGNSEPGADDNATGTAGILEAARILSQYRFDRTIIFATWSGEEYGLYGSEAWASAAAANGMNILGYFNIDMAGYLQEGDLIHTDIIAPSSANELKQFYKDVCAIYLPGFQVNDGTLSGGDSDHTSFNENGYQGIFPFEDSENYSPYIHTANDLIGPSVNNFEQNKTFVQAIIASVVTMAEEPAEQRNLIALSGDQEVNLAWDAVSGTDYYNIYRNGDTVPYSTSLQSPFPDTTVVNGTPYTYRVVAVSQFSGEESVQTNMVNVVPMPPLPLPFFDDFETGGACWAREDSWGLQALVYHSPGHSLTESPAGNYEADMNASATLRSLDLSGAYSAEISFWTRYNLEADYDFMYLEISTDGTVWDIIDSFTGDQGTWIRKTYSLDDYLNESNVIIRFHMVGDAFTEKGGMYIDDFAVMMNGVGIDGEMASPFKTNLLFCPNPARNSVVINFWLEQGDRTTILLSDAKGMLVKTLADQWTEAGTYNLEVDISDLPAGIYFATLENNGVKISRKLFISR